MKSTAESTVTSHLNRIISYRSRVPAAEAKKAEGASDDTRLTPRPPLSPLNIGKICIVDGADTISEQSIKLIMCSVSTASGRPQGVHQFGCTE